MYQKPLSIEKLADKNYIAFQKRYNFTSVLDDTPELCDFRISLKTRKSLIMEFSSDMIIMLNW